MKKPNKSVKARKATQNRGKKRRARATVSLANKHQRSTMNRLKKISEQKNFQKHLENLMPPENQ